MIALLFLPFIIELFGDAYLIKKGKKDISALWRAIGTTLFCIMALLLSPNESFIIRFIKNAIIALLPYCFFDPALNILRKKGLCYNGKTKAYDRFLSEFPCWFILIARFTAYGALIIIYNAL